MLVPSRLARGQFLPQRPLCDLISGSFKADRLLIDERKGRRLAVQEGVPVIGLVGMVLLAKKKGLIASVGAMLDRLQQEAGMYLADDVRNEALKSVAE